MFEDIDFLSLFIFGTLAIGIVTIVQTWLWHSKTLSKILWTIFIVVTWPFAILGSIIFAFIYYRSWKKIIPLLIVLVLGSGVFWQLTKNHSDYEKLHQRVQANEVLENIENKRVSLQEKPDLIEWVTEAGLSVTNLTSEDANTDFEEQRLFFSEKGWESYKKALKTAGLWNDLEKGNVEISSRMTDRAEKQLFEIKYGGEDAWLVSIPMYLNYTYNSSKPDKENKIELRFAVMQNNKGDYFIEQLIAMPVEN